MALSRHWIYKNQLYRFTLRLPAWFKTYTVIRTRRQSTDSVYQVHFKFKYRRKIYDNTFVILVYNKSRLAWQKEYADSPLTYIGERSGLSFAYLTPGELPHAFVDPATGEYDTRKYGRPIRLLKRMVNEEVPRIISTFRFLGSTIRQRRIRAARSCGGDRRIRISSYSSRAIPAPWLAPRIGGCCRFSRSKST
jgi:hypothetical protein